MTYMLLSIVLHISLVYIYIYIWALNFFRELKYCSELNINLLDVKYTNTIPLHFIRKLANAFRHEKLSCLHSLDYYFVSGL